MKESWWLTVHLSNSVCGHLSITILVITQVSSGAYSQIFFRYAPHELSSIAKDIHCDLSLYHSTIPHHVVHGGNRHWVDIPKHILSHPTVPWEGMVRLGSYHCVLLVCPVPIFDPSHPTVAWEGIDRQGYKSFLQKRQLMPPYSRLVCRKLYHVVHYRC